MCTEIINKNNSGIIQMMQRENLNFTSGLSRVTKYTRYKYSAFAGASNISRKRTAVWGSHERNAWCGNKPRGWEKGRTVLREGIMKLEASATPTAMRDGEARGWWVRRAGKSQREVTRKRRRGWTKIIESHSAGAALSRIKFTFHPSFSLPFGSPRSSPIPPAVYFNRAFTFPTFPPPFWERANPQRPPCCLIFPSSFWNFQGVTALCPLPASALPATIPTRLQWSNKGTEWLWDRWGPLLCTLACSLFVSAIWLGLSSSIAHSVKFGRFSNFYLSKWNFQ